MSTAITASATWTSEDDLLLKNSIEAGASLEALGKGAVNFSRRFTYQELQDRWHSLLYDPIVSAQASAHMFDLELSGFSPSTKSIKSENYKGHNDVPEKRKRSIRKQYYTMRKRLRSEFFNSTDFGFLDDNIIHDCDNHGSNLRESRNGKLVSDSLGLQKADLDILLNVFPETARDCDSSAAGGPSKACSVEGRNPIGDYPNRISRNEFSPDTLSLFREDERDSSMPDIKCYEIQRAAKGIRPTSEYRADNKSLPVQEPHGKRHFRCSGKKQLPACSSGVDSPQGACGFGGSQLLNSANAEVNSPHQMIGCSSPQPIWKTMEDFSVPSMPICIRDQGTVEDVATLLPNNVARKEVRSSVFDIVQSGPFLCGEQSSNDCMPCPVASDGDFVDISDSLLNLSNDDELAFTDVEEKETVDKIVNDNVNLSLQNSTDSIQRGDKVKLEHELLNYNLLSLVHLEDKNKVKCEPDLEMVDEPSKRAPNGLHRVKMEDVLSSPLDEHNVPSHLEGNLPIAPVVDVSVLSTSVVSAESREMENSTICCGLNTEDPDIPCNDDIFLLIHPSPVFSSPTSLPFSGDALSPTSISKGNFSEQQMNSSSNGKDNSQAFKRHLSVKPSFSVDAHLTNPHNSCVSKPMVYDVARFGVSTAIASRSTIDSSVIRLCKVTSNPSINSLPGKESICAQLKDKDALATILGTPQYEEAGLLKGQVATLSDSEELSDDDVPYPSDVEAMILEMDLDPPEEESSITKQAASRFRLEDTKTIVRLEQCARSSFLRTLTQKGAFAILYGHHLRQYIKKTEVVLGRSTDDLEVDIDLRKEGCANKISRRQAIIKMEIDGSFSLKNIGKGVISVNGKSVYTGQSLILSSSCLIEISRMSFAFEINQRYVRRHINATVRKKTQKNKFDWSPDYIS